MDAPTTTLILRETSKANHTQAKAEDRGTLSIQADDAKLISAHTEMVSPSEKKIPHETISHGGLTLKGPPFYVSFEADCNHSLNHMAVVFRHWSREGYVFGFSGYISYRDLEFTDAFWTNPLGVHFGPLKPSDMVLMNLDGEIIGGNRSRPANTAGFLIHAAIHRARADVHAACHCHSPAGLAWSAVSRRLDMVTQDARKFVGNAHAMYDLYGGVVFAEEEGANIACALGPRGKGCILENYGLLTVG